MIKNNVGTVANDRTASYIFDRVCVDTWIFMIHGRRGIPTVPMDFGVPDGTQPYVSGWVGPVNNLIFVETCGN